MKIALVFRDWIDPRDGMLSETQEEAIYNSLSLSNLHSGTVFNADIELSEDDQLYLAEAELLGLKPSFYVIRKDK